MNERRVSPQTGFFNDVLKSILKEVKKELPHLKTIETMTGRFTIDDLKKGSIHSPAVVISLLNIKTARKGNPPEKALGLKLDFSSE